jgi:FAD-dependent monooxygenase
MATDSDIIIVGGGPVGMVAAYMLAQRGQRSILIEQSTTTTNYPKMEYTNYRSMEIYRRIGLLERARAKAVPEHFSLNELIVTGYGGNGSLLDTWVTISRPCLERTI